MTRPVIRNEWAAWAVDTLERTARTFLQAFLGIATVNTVTDSWNQLPDTNLSLTAMLASAAIAGVWAVLTSWAAKPIGSSSSGSFLSPTLVVDEDAGTVEAEHGVELDPRFAKDAAGSYSMPPQLGLVAEVVPASETELIAQRVTSLLDRAVELSDRVTALEVVVDPPPVPPASYAERRTTALLAILEDDEQPGEVRIDAAKALTDY